MTRRYESQTATRALQDFRGVRSLLQGAFEVTVPVFDEEQFPLPTTDVLIGARWPKAKDILARGILAAAHKAGAYDLADGSKVSRGSLASREYHHLFPVDLITRVGQMDVSEADRALNCVLLTWNTNRSISAKEPVRYLEERVLQSSMGSEEISRRLSSHIVPWEELAVGGYDDIEDPSARVARVRTDYRSFLEARAEAMLGPINALCRGATWEQF